MKKCVILCMCCNNVYYQREYEELKNTWAKPIIENKYPNIEIWSYTASPNTKYVVDYNKHMIYVPCLSDALDGTFEKTYKAIQFLNFMGIEYDWLLRTNCSTIVNVGLLSKMLNDDVLDGNKIYTAQLFLNSITSSPFNNSLFCRGNFMLMSRKFSNLISDVGFNVAKQFDVYTRTRHVDLWMVDDAVINAIINTYCVMHEISPTKIWQVLPFQYMDDVNEEEESVNRDSIVIFMKKMADSAPLDERFDDEMKKLHMFMDKHYDSLSHDYTNITNNLKEYNVFYSYARDEKNNNIQIILPFEEIEGFWRMEKTYVVD